MCEPATLTAISIGLTAASGISQAVGQHQQGKATQNYYNQLAESSRKEGEIALKVGQRQSEAIQDQAKLQGKGLAQEQARLRSSQRAALSAAGVTGVTAEDIGEDTFNTQQLDELTLRYNADLKSYGAVQDATFRDHAAKVKAGQFEFAGKQARATAKRQVFNTILGTAASIASPFALKGFGSIGQAPGLNVGANTFQPNANLNNLTFSRVIG